MNINFNTDINSQAWADAIGYDIVDNKLIKKDGSKKYKLRDFEEAVQEYVQVMLADGWNLSAIEENFFVNDAREFKRDFEVDYEEIKED